MKRIIDILPHYKANYNREDVLVYKEAGQWHPIGIDDFIQTADELSYGLMAHGIAPDDKVAIISTNCPEWNFADFAIAQIGAISVPVYPTMSAKDTEFILKDAGVKIAFVLDEELLQKIDSIKANCPELERVYSFKKIAGKPHWSDIRMDGSKAPQKNKLDEYKQAVKPDQILTLIYTSGTTGTPKGVMLSHNNLISNVVAAGEVCPVNSTHKILSFLPLSHIFERMLVYLYLYQGAGVYYAESLETIGDNLKEVKPFAFSTVPRLLEKVYDKIVAKGNELTGIKRKLFFWALDLGHKYELDGANGLWYEMQLKIANKIIFSKWREALGGNIGVIVSGSAALQPRLARVFTAARINVLEGYGLTETSPVITVNRLDKGMRGFGTVGPPIRDVEIKIAADGEILCKGPNVMLGYYKRQDFTDEVLKDGWLHTGDIGEMDGQLLKITDRKKEMFKTSGGKYIAPQMMENKFKESTYIEQIMVVGENKKHPSALIVPSFDALKEWAKKQEKSFSSNSAMCEDADVHVLIQSEVDRLNSDFGHYEMVKKFCLMPSEWSVATGELTPKLSLKRRVIQEKFNDKIEAFYAS
ncbi:MAG: long-chain fatty acid--CoA ligase [Bacteroidia bacterium]